MRNAGTMVSFHRPDGQAVEGYLAKPAKLEGAPAIVVIQEWWGLNAQIRGVADRLSHAGYIALIPTCIEESLRSRKKRAATTWIVWTLLTRSLRTFVARFNT
ncbi:dienelactone hydrolase family protein [Paraburkholderia sp. BL25I1N1]|nr:dienelactone hydrolase family protein [Paraburkholderia sp. BL25I1N1]